MMIVSKHKKYQGCLEFENVKLGYLGINGDKRNIPIHKELLLSQPRENGGFRPGVPFGLSEEPLSNLVGLPKGTDGNIALIGPIGSGKSSGIAKPALATYGGPICATDIKGELCAYYDSLLQEGYVTRPFIKFDPTNPDGPSYDPFGILRKDIEQNLLGHIQDLAYALRPNTPNDSQPFWASATRSLAV